MIVTSADGVPIAYTVAGSGPPLVLLHGFSETGESWQEAGYLGRFLQGGRRVVLIDCRGHGGSGKPDEPAATAATSGRAMSLPCSMRSDCPRPTLPASPWAA